MLCLTKPALGIPWQFRLHLSYAYESYTPLHYDWRDLDIESISDVNIEFFVNPDIES